ncbi:MAG: T9SS type A sorting domain-containing protein, partial [Candidatus Latescibacteria bacterium]|nr:T9SS type A sorting domain-containing protein [Candidatus Latescibacterota bacterium]NIO56570.1 T9SS type A sorting domain-containing protein [Candidatus Latescibacterota bacterium]NIT39043.1 T9SS type A sorting domain-containing protein [Candidatus Latescibacterota bacterium]
LPVAGGSTEGEGAQGEGGEITKEEDTKLPLKYELSYNYPNPFNPVTTLRYDVPSPGSVVSIVIYNIKGQAVKRLMNQYKAPGFHSIAWNGKDDRGESVASGIYFVQMKAEGFRQTRKLVLLK